MTLKEIVEDYKANSDPSTWYHWNYCKEQSNIKTAIFVACMSLDARGRKHTHQKQWVGDEQLIEMTKLLLPIASQIEKAKDFEELYQKVASSKQYGVGQMTLYDIATRLGHRLNIYPDLVYLHAGAAEGAKKLLQLKTVPDKMPLAEFPEEFQECECYEVEDILCHYKKYF